MCGRKKDFHPALDLCVEPVTIAGMMNMSLTWWYVALLVSGVLLGIGEIFVPGGIAGAIGACFCAAAMVIGFRAFPPPWGLISALTVVVLGGAAFLVWIRLFPQSRAGKRIVLTADGRDQKSSDPPGPEWVGREGVATTALRPGGIVDFGERRCDVLAEGSEWLAVGVKVRISAIRDGQVWVREVRAP